MEDIENFQFAPSSQIEHEVTVSRLEAMRKAILRSQPPTEVIGGDIEFSETGWNLRITALDSGDAASLDGFQITRVSEDFIFINPGTVNGALVDASGGTYNKIAYNPSSSEQFLSLSVTTGDFKPTAVSYDISSSPPDGIDIVKNQPPASLKILLAIIKSQTVIQNTPGNITISPSEVIEIPKTSVQIGEYPNDIYYSWYVTRS